MEKIYYNWNEPLFMVFLLFLIFSHFFYRVYSNFSTLYPLRIIHVRVREKKKKTIATKKL